MTRSIVNGALLLLASFSGCNALAPHHLEGRRAFFQGVASAVTATAVMVGSSESASAVIAKTGQASPWTGDYDDPNHPGCLRQVKVVGAAQRPDGTPGRYPIVEVRGYDGPQGATICTEQPEKRDAIWTVKGELKSGQAFLDFSSKGGPSKLLAKYEDNGIIFPDGNKWSKVPSGTPERLPKEMSTLKSK